MNPDTGEVRCLTPEEKQRVLDDSEGRRRVKIKGSWWIETKVEPNKKQMQSGVKGWHDCLCGSGRKFRDCCRTCKCGSKKSARECCRKTWYSDREQYQIKLAQEAV